VVISHDEISRHGVPVVLPVTRTRRGYATHVELDGVLPVVSYVQCELIRAVSVDRLIRPVASLDLVHVAKVETILLRILRLPTG
jgi:mRNA interferase MazF